MIEFIFGLVFGFLLAVMIVVPWAKKKIEEIKELYDKAIEAYDEYSDNLVAELEERSIERNNGDICD